MYKLTFKFYILYIHVFFFFFYREFFKIFSHLGLELYLISKSPGWRGGG